mmetsp:Transcript_30170/g.76301  ORF Transcript_30170/g.76301 Transcript_30170/m.76301 type:complete len:227 (+) Transcript_30170:525-1205(+)
MAPLLHLAVGLLFRDHLAHHHHGLLLWRLGTLLPRHSALPFPAGLGMAEGEKQQGDVALDTGLAGTGGGARAPLHEHHAVALDFLRLRADIGIGFADFGAEPAPCGVASTHREEHLAGNLPLRPHLRQRPPAVRSRSGRCIGRRGTRGLDHRALARRDEWQRQRAPLHLIGAQSGGTAVHDRHRAGLRGRRSPLGWPPLNDLRHRPPVGRQHLGGRPELCPQQSAR